MSFISLAVTFLLLTLSCDFGTAFQVKVKQGILDEGVLSKSRNGTHFYSFYGIPYAKPPIGELRFELPQEPDPWLGVRDTKTPPPICIQEEHGVPHLNLKATERTAGKEDCLYLNVFTPGDNISTLNLLPVVVFIHGGVWHHGNLAFFDPMYFMDYPVVFVAFQYRLSIFGFLSAADDILPGNLGMKDQVTALKWVQQNIQAFGGNPRRVTLLGGSSGAMSVHFHMYSPLNAGLFHQAMSLSGTALTLGAMVSSKTAKDRSRALGVLLGCRGEGTTKLVNCLRKLPAEELTISMSKFYVWDIFPVCPFGIVVEGKHVPGAFLTEYPWRQDIVHKIPWFTGINADEGCFITARLLSMNLWNDLMQNYKRLAPIVFSFGEFVDSISKSVVSNALQKFYFNDRDDFDDNPSATRSYIEKIVKLFTDADYAVGAIEATRRTANKISIYFYVYNHRNFPSSVDAGFNLTENLGICHGDDLLSVMYMKDIRPPVREGPDFIVSKRLMQYAINFIYYSDPNGNTAEKVWLPVQTTNLEYLHIKTDSDTMEKNLFHERYTFWRNNILPLLNINRSHNDKVKVEL